MHRLFFLIALVFASPACAEWWEARTDHFIVYSQSSSKEAKEFAEKLERFDQALRSLQRMKQDEQLSDSRRVTIYRSGDRTAVAALAGSSQSGIAGFYRPSAAGPVAFVPAREKSRDWSDLDPLTILFHEYAHHFMYRHFPAAYPSWYVEGLAETYSTIDLKDDGSFHLGNAPQERGAALSGALNFSIQRMLLSTDKPNFEDYYGRYSHGWLLTHFLTFEPSRSGQLGTYLTLINKGVSPSDAAQQAFGNLRKLEQDAWRYKHGKLPGALVRPGDTKPPTASLRRLGPDEEAVMRSQMRSKAGVNRKAARDVYSDIQPVAAQYPRSHAVQLALTEAAFDAEDYDAADRAADAALAVRPQSVEALIFKGRVAMERAKSDPAEYATARRWFAKAHAADPAHPVPLFQNYMAYSKAGGAIPESAVLGLERAYSLAPYDSELRLVLARQLLWEKKVLLARDILIPLALAPHESKQAKALNEVIALIDSAQVEEAGSKLAARLALDEKEAEEAR